VFQVRVWEEAREDPRLKPVWRGAISDLQRHRLVSFTIVGKLSGLFDSSQIDVGPYGDDRNETQE
jgi:hypothetical protein